MFLFFFFLLSRPKLETDPNLDAGSLRLSIPMSGILHLSSRIGDTPWEESRSSGFRLSESQRKSSGHEHRPDHLDLSSGSSTTTNFDKKQWQSLQSLAKPQWTWRRTIGSGEEPDSEDLTDNFFNGAQNVEVASNIIYTPFGLTKPSMTTITTVSRRTRLNPTNESMEETVST